MRIEKKFFFTNITINLVAMLTLGLMIGLLIAGYIRRDAQEDLVKENNLLGKIVLYKTESKSRRDPIAVVRKNLVTRLGTIDNVAIYEGNITNERLVMSSFTQTLTDEEMDNIVNRDIETVYSIKIEETWYLAYNDRIEVTQNKLKVPVIITTMIPNQDVRQLITKIIVVLVSLMILTSVLIIIATGYLSRRISKPIQQLTKTTKDIADKNYRTIQVVNTGDEIEELSKAMYNMARSIENYDKEQRKFYENISHELKTPLTVIGGYAEGIKTGIFASNDDALDTIVDETKHLKKQLENIIYLSKLDSLEDDLHLQTISMNQLLADALQRVESLIILNDIDVDYVPIEDVTIKMDYDKGIKMLTNIFTNCVKYTNDLIIIRCIVDDQIYHIQIKDNGEGFSQEILHQPFKRLKLDGKEGNGIGLSIVKKIVETHKGDFSIANDETGGAIYNISIPIRIL